MYPDIYFEPEFGALYQKIEGGEPLHITFETDDGRIEDNVIKREIPTRVDGEVYYDLITPYGYGGPIITKLTGSKEQLLADFSEYMAENARKEHIVSEFVRFHPIMANDEDFAEIYDVKDLRPVVQTKIDGEDTFQREFSKSTRKTTRRALRDGAEYRVTQAPESIESFKEIYYDTMDRVDASDFYFFDDAYFDALQEKFNDHLLLIEVLFEEKVVAAAIYFIYEGIMHAHLSGTDSDYLKYSPAYVTKYAAVEWGDEHGAKVLYSGGGTTNDSSDGLYRFKKRFSDTEDLRFKIGTRIWDEEAYDALVAEMFGSDVPETDFFPLYRMKKESEDRS